MAELMHNNVILEMFRQEQDPVAKIQILERRATPPAGALVTDRDPIPGQSVKLIPIL